MIHRFGRVLLFMCGGVVIARLLSLVPSTGEGGKFKFRVTLRSVLKEGVFL
jgi:hypothetical protein